MEQESRKLERKETNGSLVMNMNNVMNMDMNYFLAGEIFFIDCWEMFVLDGSSSHSFFIPNEW